MGVLVAVVLLVLGAPAYALARDFEHPASQDTSRQFAPGNVQRQDTPTDPDYDKAEPDDEDGSSSSNLYDERFDLFGFPSARTPTAIYREGPDAGRPMISGFNAAGAWKLTRGEPSVTIAILDTGIKWDRESLRTKVHLDRGELPMPGCGAHPDAYDANGDGAFDVRDYECDPRVHPDAGAHGDPAKVDAEDLIATFSDGTDADGNGYVDDIAGWDFFDDDNDPYDASSYFAAANHGSGRADEAAGATDDGAGAPGVCPHCQLMPLRIWDTFVSDQNDFALGVLYAADNGAKVVEGADGGLYHSDFAEHASQYAYDHGVVQTYSGDDLNTGNHNFPANYSHAMLIQGTVPDTVGLPNSVGTYFRGAGTTQYGGHSSGAMDGSTGSENTGKASGAAGMVVSAALEHPGGPIELRPDETREILEATAEDVTGGPSGVDGNVAGVGAPDRAQPGWDPHFGWGRVDLGAAVSLAHGGAIPPEAAIDEPDWFAPLTGASLRVSGRARARFADGGRFHWRLEWGPGLAPQTWHTAAEGAGSGEVDDFGTIDLTAVRAALAAHPPPPDPGMPAFAPSANPYANQFAVRLTVTGDGIPTPGVDRRVFTALDDPTLEPGFPKRVAAGGEAPAHYADVDGDGTQELVLPLEDGTVHVMRSDGSEPAGFPVRTEVQLSARDHASAPGVAAVGPPLEPPRGVAVADLDDDGVPELITTAGVHIYAWEPDGSVRPGFPVSLDRSFCRPQDESQPLHHRKCGFLATPAVGRLEGRGRPLDVVAPALDGHVYAVRGDGSAVPGFPVALVDPGVPPDQQMLAESINEPAIGDLDGDGHDDVVAASNEAYGAAPPGADDIAGLFEQGFADLLAGVTDTSTRVYAISGATGRFLPGWPVKLNGGIQNTLPLIGPGHDPALVRVGGRQQVVTSATGGALSEYGTDGRLTRGMQQSDYGPASAASDRTGALNLFESASVGDVLGAGRPAVVKYQTTLSAASNLLLTGQNAPWQHLIGAFDAGTGVTLPAFPAVTDDYQFLSSSTIARVDPASPANQVVAPSGLGELHAFDGATGREAPGFPKLTGGWLFAPAALARDGRMADVTREGFLFQWRTPAPACQPEWPAFRHDLQHSGNYDRDGTPPGPIGAPARAATRITWRAPGDDGPCRRLGGHYEVATSKDPITPASFAAAARVTRDVPAPADPGTPQAMTVPGSAARYVAIRAVDAAGNVGPLAVLAPR